MGVAAYAALASVAVSAASAYSGAQQNKKAAAANDAAQALSREDYNNRLAAAAKMAGQLNEEYNELTKKRPDLTWSNFVKDKIRAIDDPYLRESYTNAKEEDFNKMRDFAKAASSDNIDTVREAADKLSNGKWREIIDKRDKLVLNTDAASRMSRAYELAAPIRTGASTVRYDEKGRLIEGQRADKQAFNVAQEVQTQIEQEQKQDLRLLENDRMGAAQSQTEKAKSFMQFFDATGYATAAESDRTNLLNNFQIKDEDRAFDIYKLFAQAASGITPTQPTYQSTTGGNALISEGVRSGTEALKTYSAYKTDQDNKAAAAKAAGTYGST